MKESEYKKKRSSIYKKIYIKRKTILCCTYYSMHCWSIKMISNSNKQTKAHGNLKGKQQFFALLLFAPPESKPRRLSLFHWCHSSLFCPPTWIDRYRTRYFVKVYILPEPRRCISGLCWNEGGRVWYPLKDIVFKNFCCCLSSPSSWSCSPVILLFCFYFVAFFLLYSFCDLFFFRNFPFFC